jgi:hypothetical protein
MDAYIDQLAVTDPEQLEKLGIALDGSNQPPTGTQVVTLPGGKSVTVEVIDDRGCVGQARRSIEGEDLGLFISMRREIESIGIQASDRALADPRVIAAVQAWTKCMTEQGFDVGSPSEAVEIGSELGANDPQAGRLMAEVDVGCKVEASLTSTYREVRNGYEQQLLDRQPGLIDEWRRLSDEALRRATEVIDTN